MTKVTIIGYQLKTQTVVREVSDWPDEIDIRVAIARAAREADVVLVEGVLVE